MDHTSSSHQVIDDGTIIFYHAPSSYTGEDAIELFVHGGNYIVDRILEILLKLGFQMASPGEFTQRAVLNNKIDLTQAEGISELTQATTKNQWVVARSLSQGHLSDFCEQIRGKLITTLAIFEAAMDFPEEHDTETIQSRHILLHLDELRNDLDKLQDTYRWAHVARSGLRIVLCGRANAGKSSLFNMLCGQNRAIVTDEPGTTRDYLEETIHLGGSKIILCDTAGLRTTNELTISRSERIAIHRSLECARQAHLIVLAQPSTDAVPVDLPEILSNTPESKDLPCPYILRVRTFADQDPHPPWSHPDDLITSLPQNGQEKGVDELKTVITQYVNQWMGELDDQPALSTPRQKQAVQKATDHLNNACTYLTNAITWDLVAEELKIAADSLSDVIGTITTDAILDEVFSQFCLGK